MWDIRTKGWFLGVADTNDVIQKIEKTLNNTHTTTQKLTNNSFRNTKKHLTKVIPIVVGALGTIPLRLKENLRTIGVDTSIELIQRCALLGSARILSKVLEM